MNFFGCSIDFRWSRRRRRRKRRRRKEEDEVMGVEEDVEDEMGQFSLPRTNLNAGCARKSLEIKRPTKIQ